MKTDVEKNFHPLATFNLSENGQFGMKGSTNATDSFNCVTENKLTYKNSHSINPSSKSNGTAQMACSIPADECWLIKPSKEIMVKESIEPISNWLRNVFESPDSCFFHSRRNLLSRLEAILLAGGQTTAYQFGGSVPSLNLLPSGHPFLSSQVHLAQNVGVFENSVRLTTASSTDSLSLAGQRPSTTSTFNNQQENVGTFTRSKRARPSLPPQHSNNIQRKNNGSPNSRPYLSNSLASNPFIGRSVNKTGSYDELDITSANTNVQEIARIQEDNLKAEVAALHAAAAAGRHGSHHSINSLCRGSPNGSYTNISSAPESPHSSNTKLAQPQPVSKQYSTDQSLYDTWNMGNQLLNQQQLLQHAQISQLSLNSSLNPNGLESSSTNNVAYGFNNSYLKQNPFKLLPPKPILPDLNQESAQFTKISSNLPNHPQIEPVSHFGFRPSRKTSVPNPPKSVPSGFRRVSDVHSNTTNNNT